jgi:hypothetical protein
MSQFKTISELRDSVSGMLQGLDLNDVTNLNTALERVARQTCVLLNIPEATLRSTLTLYDGVTDYLCPTDMFASAIVDIRPQGQTRWMGDDVNKQPMSEFDQEKGFQTSTKTTVEYDKGTGIIRVVSPYPTARIELDPMTDTTGWTAGGSASALTADSTVFWQAPSSLRMLLTGASTGTLTKTIPSQDLTAYKSVGVGFLAFRTPASNLTSIELRLGSSASAYYSIIVTAGFLKAFTAGDWMLASFDLSTATTVGVPDITKITYAQLQIVHANTLTNFYVGDLWISLPTPSTLIYQTDAIFLPSGSTSPINTITNTSDQVLLNDAAYAIYEVKCAIDIAQQQGGTLASGVIATLAQELNGVRGYRGVLVQLGMLDIYRAQNPSQVLRTSGSYYDM